MPLLAAFPSGGRALLLIAIAIALWLLVEFTGRKRRSLRTWIVDGIIAASLVVGIAFLPVQTHAWIARLGLGFILGIALLYVLYLMSSARTIRRTRKDLVGTEEVRGAERVDLPPSLEPGWNAFVELGFEPVATVRLANGSVFAHLVRVEDGIVAEVVAHPPPHDTTPVLELSSTLAGRIGVLATSTIGLSPRLWPGELRQVFPGATANHLLENHLTALDFLKGRGIESDEVRVDEVLEVKDEMLGRDRTFTARVPTRALGREMIRASLGRHAAIGALATQEDIGERINAFYDLRAREGPEGLTERRPD